MKEKEPMNTDTNLIEPSPVPREPKLLGLYPYCGLSKRWAIIFWIVVITFGIMIGNHFGPKIAKKVTGDSRPLIQQWMDK